MKILVSALEPSANLHLEPILKALGECELCGIFDERFGEPLLPSRAFSIMGFLDAIPKIKKAKEAIKKMAQMSLHVDKVLLIDSPAFNLPLAKAIKELNPNVKIIYYILPQVWAWKAKRVAKVEKYCDVLASILPFEKQFYSKATYVGHPLLDEIPTFKKSYEKTGTIAFLPGSRKSEIKTLLPIYKAVSKTLGKRSILVIPPHFSATEIEQIYGDVSQFELSKNTYDAFLQSEFAFVCSGTATLEAALVGVPFVLAYKAKWLDYVIAKRFVKLLHVGLANILFDFEKLPPLHVELLQKDVNVENLIKAYKDTNLELFFKRALTLRTLLRHGSKEEMIKIMSV
ncbi:MAG: lipid-A-disaccharide synthase [Sulfurospirillaceae bacterium]|nr:lipid-A-disaccharide synthase [Sulfurospirillaceae bacterium]